MRTVKQIFIWTLAILVTSCGSQTDKKIFEHNYENYSEKYTEQQLIDTLYSDTLNVGPDAQGGWTSREFYKNTTKELITDLQKTKFDGFYPMTEFDELTIMKLPFSLKKTFTNEQTTKFLEIINDPVSFDWGETTYEPEYRIDFLKDNKIVAVLTCGIQDMAIIKTKPDWPEFKRMKFGKIKSERYNDFVSIINELEK